MYQFSRAIYRELARDIDADVSIRGACAHEHVLRSCEATIERLVSDRHYFARPSRTLFYDIRTCFPMRAQSGVWAVVHRYVNAADAYLQPLPAAGFDANGQPLQCPATTRR